LSQAAQLLKKIEELKGSAPKRKFTQSLELVVKLREVDLNKPENRINELVELPNPLNKPVKICVIAGGEMGLRAKEAGADAVFGRDDVEKLAADKKAAKKIANAYDHFIAEAPMMPLVGKTLGAVLGPRAKMPTPVPPNAPIADIIKRHRKMIRIRVRGQPVIQCRVGTEDMESPKIVENINAVLSALERRLERGARSIAFVVVKPTMGPPMKVSVGKA